MVEYDVEEIASELMLTTSELREVFDLYFEDAATLLPDCQQVMDNQDYKSLRQIMHGFKGASANLRMDKLTDLAADLEIQAAAEREEGISLSLERVQEEINAIKEYLDAFYAEVEK